MDRRSTWVRSLIGVGLLAAVALPGCGSSEASTPEAPTTTVPGTPTEDLTVSDYLSASMAPMDDQGTFVVVDGTAPGDDGTVEATLRIGDFDGDVTSYDLPTPPLLYPKAWVDDGTIYVQGQACDDPLLDQIGEGDPHQICGTELGGSTLVALDVETGQSRVISTTLPADRFGSLVVTPAGPVALLEAYVPGSDLDDPDGFEYSLLEAATGEVTPLGTGPATEKLCPSGEGFIGTESDDSFSSTDDAATQEIRLTIIDQDGTRVVLAPEPPETLNLPFPTGCTADGSLVFPDTADATTSVQLGVDADGTPTWTEVRVDPLPVDDAGVVVPISVPGGQLAWEPTGDTGVSFEGYVPYLLVDGRWDARPMVPGPDSPSLSAISGSHLLTLHEARADGPLLIVR